MNDKSIIGFGYKPNFAKAVCLKTNSITRLGGVEYKIIAAPYERAFIKTLHNPGGTRVRYNAMAINILDPLTGLTYAVEYHPANLVRKDAAAPQASVSGSPEKDLKAYVEQIKSFADTLNEMAKNNPDVAKHCGVLLIFNRIDKGGKTLWGGGLFNGNARAVQIGLEESCREHPEFYPFLAEVVENIASKSAFELALRLGGIVCGASDEWPKRCCAMRRRHGKRPAASRN